MKYFLVLILLATNVVPAQVRYLVTPTNDAIQMHPGESAARAARRIGLVPLLQPGCSDSLHIGFPPDVAHTQAEYPIGPVGVVGMWFIAPATGTIDTIFWMGGNSVGVFDSVVYLQIHRSNIYPGNGPGTSPYPGPCTPWGYWVNTNDLVGNVAPFREEATDTTWQSTISGPSSFPLVGEVLWGDTGGFPVIDHANSLNFAAMSLLGGPVAVNQGDAIFVSLRTQGSNLHEVSLTTWPANASESPLPPRDWVFYERDGTSNLGLSGVACGGSNPLPAGWFARGGPTGENDGFVWNWWFTMTVSSVLVPPRLRHYDVLGNTFSHEARTISAEITDCFPPAPPESLYFNLLYSVNNGLEQTLSMGSGSASVPGQPGGALVQYHVVAGNQVGKSEAYGSYRVYDLVNSFYVADSAAEYQWNEIDTSGSVVTGWFVSKGGWDYDIFPNDPADNGTAGPIDLGGPFQFFDSTFRYAWVGVDGALCLSADPADTIFVDRPADVYPNYAPEIPGGLPRNCVAPFYKDFVLWPGTSSKTGHGHVYFKLTGERCIIQWDSVANAADFGDTVITFQAILDRSDNTITFLYKNVGDTAGQSVTGLQMERQSRWFFYNRNSTPSETKLRNGLAVKITPAAEAVVQWNLVSNPNQVADPRKESVFPRALSPAFAYRQGYAVVDTLENGIGYWMKFNPAFFNIIPGSPLSLDTAAVSPGWNMIGSIGTPLPTAGIREIPDSILTSHYFGYGAGGYLPADTIQPAIGYWVKAKSAGRLILGSTGPLTTSASSPNLIRSCDRLSFHDVSGRSRDLYFSTTSIEESMLQRFELPPPPPDHAFDVRFKSNRILESPTGETARRIAIAIGGAVYPLTIEWHRSPIGAAASLMVGDREYSTKTQGSVSVTSPDLAVNLVLSPRAAEAPARFALLQNYPDPFNPTTSITYDLAEASRVSLRIFNVLGELVKVLVNGMEDAGRHRVEFDARSLASGVYFYRLEAGDGRVPHVVETRKMILLR